MQQVLQSEKAQEMINFITPKFGKSYIGLWLFQVMGIEIDELQLFINEIKKQIVYQTATWGLYYLQQEYQIDTNAELLEIIPGVNEEELPENIKNIITNARAAISVKIKERYPSNPKNVENIIAEIAGRNVSITENTAKNTFDVLLASGNNAYSIKNIMIKINQIKPAHLIVKYYEHMNIGQLHKYTHGQLHIQTHDMLKNGIKLN